MYLIPLEQKMEEKALLLKLTYVFLDDAEELQGALI